MNKTIIFTQPGKGGTGKTSFMCLLFDYLNNIGIAVRGLDCEPYIGFQHYIEEVSKVDLENERALGKTIKDFEESKDEFLLLDIPSSQRLDKFVETVKKMNLENISLISCGFINFDINSLLRVGSQTQELSELCEKHIFVHSPLFKGLETNFYEDSEEVKTLKERFNIAEIYIKPRPSTFDFFCYSQKLSIYKISQLNAPNTARYRIRAKGVVKRFEQEVSPLHSFLGLPEAQKDA